MYDPLIKRVQFEIGISFTLFPQKSNTWRNWLFDLEFGLIWPGKIIMNPRIQFPHFGQGYVNDLAPPKKNPMDPNEMREYKWESLCFWLHGAIRICGIDIGAGLFYRLPMKGN